MSPQLLLKTTLPPLTTLLLTHNTLRNKGAQILAAFLSEDQHITRLDLGWNAIGDAGAYALAAMLRKNNTLKVLGLKAGVNSLGGGHAAPTFSVASASRIRSIGRPNFFWKSFTLLAQRVDIKRQANRLRLHST